MTQETKTDDGSLFWLELFFDLVAVAAMVVLATSLEHHPTWSGIGVFAVTFTAIWMCWSSLAFYVNAANERAERRTIIFGMGAVAVMAATLLQLHDHANVFAVAFIVCRVGTFSATRRAGRTVAGWSLLAGGATTPWLVSLWVPGSWKYALWALGLVIDLTGQLWRRDAGELQQRMEERARRDGRGPGRQNHGPGRDRRGGPGRDQQRPQLVEAPIRQHHLVDRLGTFVIIVLGESVMQLVRAASETEWSPAMWVIAGIGFVVVVGIWRQTFAYGFTAAPGPGRIEDNLAIGMIVHLFTTGSLVVLAAGLGVLVRHAGEHVEPDWAWITAGALAVHLATSTVAGILTGAPKAWIWFWGVPGIVVAIAAGFLGPLLPAGVFAVLLLAPVLWEVLYGRKLTSAVTG